MPVGRYFRGLTAYDLLGNIVPGVIALVVTMGFLHSPPIPGNLGEYGLFTAIAFSVGAILQPYASKAVGRRENFDETMDSVEDLPSLQREDDGSESTDDDDCEEDVNDGRDICELAWRMSHPFVGPLCGWWRPRRGEQLDDRILANRIWTHLVDTHEIPFRTESYSVLYHVMSSRVDDARSPSRATRIQAIRNFHRGMWLASWYSLVLVGIAIVVDTFLIPGDPVAPFGVEYARPAYFDYWTPVWHLAVVAVAGVVVFWLLFESTEEDYIEYLFADYAVAIGSEGNTVSLGEGTELAISGNLHTTLETDSLHCSGENPGDTGTQDPNSTDSESDGTD
ncbi:hypothetical protein NGM10_07410 [Halorussus salilacus]|uniref:hypothetical protein n=1 Tax=Halorussus salilacus TaxID=2953750 RepID=UPI00209ED5D9|nr:hypothetical protein [Halorussus salilacus]USZ69550.1 hypothetical protein NGM10_07410 [Halorussus salilacus]